MATMRRMGPTEERGAGDGGAERRGVEVRDVAPGLWLWRTSYPDGHAGHGWGPVVASTCVRTSRHTVLIDPLAPPDTATEVWSRLHTQPPTVVVVLKPDHVRDVNLFVGRYGAKAFGPQVYFRGDVPQTVLEPIVPGSRFAGGLEALYDGRGRNETPLWLPEQRTIVFADALTAPTPEDGAGGEGAGGDGSLRVWWTPWHGERVLPALRALLDLPFERVIVSHGDPVHDRTAFERALDLPPWSAP